MRTPRGYRRLANGLLKKTTTKRRKKQTGRKRGGNLKTTATRVATAAKAKTTVAARKAITDLMLTEGLEKSIDLDDAGNVSMEPTLVFRAVKHSLRAVLDSHDVKLQGSTALCFLIEGFPCTLAQAQIFEAHNNPARFLIVRKFYYPV